MLLHLLLASILRKDCTGERGMERKTGERQIGERKAGRRERRDLIKKLLVIPPSGLL
jgi:hypothetical protein